MWLAPTLHVSKFADSSVRKTHKLAHTHKHTLAHAPSAGLDQHFFGTVADAGQHPATDNDVSASFLNVLYCGAKT